MRTTLVIVMLIQTALLGCGIKGDPLPPAEIETIQKQEAPTNPDTLATPKATSSTTNDDNDKKKKKK